jgi:uncharacterized cupin superfamily protein
VGLKRVNFLNPELQKDDDDPPGFGARYDRFGPKIGAAQLGTTLYELPQGEAICPYHYEYPEEEWLLVVSGTPSVRHPEGEDVLEPGDIVCFPSGPEGAHQILNRAEEIARVLMFSTKQTPAVAVYPDSNKVAYFTGNDADNRMLRMDPPLDYFDGETGPSTEK